MAASRRGRWRSLATREGIDAARRHAGMRLDQAWALAEHQVAPTRSVPMDPPTRLALISVNFSTTRYLQLMLLTLCEQDRLGLVQRIILVDNASRDGGRPFLRRLDARVPRLHLVERQHLLSHARGMRAGVRALDRVDAGDAHPANLLLFCDPDVVFRRPTVLTSLTSAAQANGASLVGEQRPRGDAVPSIQASFFAVAREVYARRDIRPLVHHGSPAYWQQQSIWRAGLTVVDFPSNHGGHILHRGRTGVAAAGTYLPHHPYASVTRSAPHFMGVRDGAAIWETIEARHAELLEPDQEDRLLEVLSERLSVLGTEADTDRAAGLP